MAKQNRQAEVLDNVAGIVPDVQPYDYKLPGPGQKTTFTTDSGQQFELIGMDRGLPLIQQAGAKRPRSLATESICATEYHSDARLVATVVGAFRTAVNEQPATAKGKATATVGEWRVRIGDTVPTDLFTAREIADRLAAGTLAASTLVWRDGMAKWARPADCPDISRLTPPPID